ncbi:MAG TPA: biotin/lipoyl-containing protein [Terriglobales bacterium]|nr:biotin/lipoyl-containing protein [Terriglobales bacterium]
MKLQISVDGKAYEVEVEVPAEEYGGRTLGGYVPPYAPTSAVTLPSPPPAPAKAPKRNGRDEGPVDDDKVCRSPIAGIVIKVNIQEGQQIQADDLMMVLEAMKMETNVTAPVAGKVKKINVEPGEGVHVSQVLVEFE